ncbi:MAG: YDG domain-containing protein [Candidatus Fibromonas sp.]|nr:YDG domain-containing protein [Candidatus Fibromonas sp.]
MKGFKALKKLTWLPLAVAPRFIHPLGKSFFVFLCFSATLSAQNTDWYNASDTKFEISTAEQLKGLAQLVNDGTSSFIGKTITLIEDVTLAEDFIPIGKDSVWNKMFLGTFDGNGHSISGLSVSNVRAAGLFGFNWGQIKNLTIKATKIKATATSGRAYAGVLAGFYNSQSPIENCYVIADSVVASGSAVSVAGGLAGFIRSKISNSYSTANVLAISTDTDSGSLAGGLAGAALAIENSYSTGNVSAINTKSSIAGGLVGEGADITYSGTSISELASRSKLTILNSYSTGNVSAQSAAGGLAGATIGWTEISKSYSTGNISVNGSSLSNAGGLVGMMMPLGGAIVISNSYSAGDVSAISSDNTLNMSWAYSGGLIGYANASDITNSYARGKISGKTSSDNFGGIFGRYTGGTLTSVYYNSDATIQPSGQGSPAGIEAKSMDELKMKETFAGWDFEYVWGIEEASVPPFLNFWFPISNDIEYFKILDQTYTGSQIRFMPVIRKKDGTLLTKGIDYELSYGENKNAGEGTINVTGKNAYSGISKIITFKIIPKKLTVIGAVAQNKTYDGTDIATITGATLRDVASGDDVFLLNATIGTFASANASGGNVSVSTNMLLAGESATNYFLVQPELVARIEWKFLKNDAIEPIDDQDYTGFAIEPAIIVKDNTKVLILETDYTLRYSNNINPGMATVEVTGNGNYAGQVRINFTISSDGSVPVFFNIETINSAVAAHNAINLQVQTAACLQIYSLSGELKKTLYFKNGVYNVTFGDLPKGMYIAKIIFDNEKKKLKIPII